MEREQQAVLELCKWQNPDGARLSALFGVHSSAGAGAAAGPADLRWILGQSLWGRAGGMAYLALEKSGLLYEVNREFRNTLESVYMANRTRSQSFQNALSDLAAVLGDADFPYALLKGAYLAQLYPAGLRTSNDIDVLISSASLPALEERLEGCGYIQGRYDRAEGRIIPATRREKLLSRMNRGETLPYCRKTDYPMMPCVEIDLNFSLDYKAKDDGVRAVERLLEAARPLIPTSAGNLFTLAPDDFLLHLCAHLYKEAAVYQWVRMGRDLSLYKFCDIDLIAAQALQESTPEALAQKIKGLALETACAFSLSRTERLLGTNKRAGAGWTRLLQLLGADPDEDVYEILEPASGRVYENKMDFVNWMFCADRLHRLQTVEKEDGNIE